MLIQIPFLPGGKVWSLKFSKTVAPLRRHERSILLLSVIVSSVKKRGMMFLSGYLSPLHYQSIFFVGLRRKGGKPAEEAVSKYRNTGSGPTAGLC